LFDVEKPITDASHFEIEKSTISGKAYQTGGGRTVDSDVIDILLTWTVNHDREFLEGGTTKATKPGTKNFAYFAAPNMDLQSVVETVEVNASPDWRCLLASSDRKDSLDRNRPRSIAYH
jgi:hypothetical protein